MSCHAQFDEFQMWPAVLPQTAGIESSLSSLSLRMSSLKCWRDAPVDAPHRLKWDWRCNSDSAHSVHLRQQHHSSLCADDDVMCDGVSALVELCPSGICITYSLILMVMINLLLRIIKQCHWSPTGDVDFLNKYFRVKICVRETGASCLY